MPTTIIVGGQWGDEGKGKFASYLALTDKPTIACRAGLGPGAGHTVVYQGATMKFRQIPGGMIARPRRVLIGAGCLVRPAVVLGECETYGLFDRIGIDHRASIITDEQMQRDRADPHLAKVIESTGSGHGPCLMDRAMRVGLMAKDAEELRPYLCDVSAEINEALDRGEEVQIEGTNGYLLSVLYGSYPYTVGKDSTAATVAADVGVGPLRINEVVLAFKTFPTRVGKGVFPTEMSEEEARRRAFDEYGTVTGRRRRVGEFDFRLAAEAARVNGPSQIALSFLDRIDPDCRGRTFEQLSPTARAFIDRVEDALQTPVTLIGTGPDTLDTIDRRGHI